MKLIVKMTASFLGMIGYGYVYKCKILDVIQGDIDEKEIAVTILANDEKYIKFMSTHLDTVELEMGCSRRNSNEPYSMMAISGFVDKYRTSWQIEYLKEASH